MKLILNTIWTVVILVMMNNAIAREALETGHHELTWFSTSTSALLNRSSTEMATKRTNRGIRLALIAMQNKLSLPDQLIANHNLCVGFLRKDEINTAKSYCTQAKKLAGQAFKIVRVRGAYYLTEQALASNSKKSLSLYNAVLNNIEHQNSKIQISLVR